jgi:hypothetical protein
MASLVTRNIAQEAAAKAARDAASKAARDAASKAARDAAEKAARDAAEKAAKDAAEKAAKKASKLSASDAAKLAAAAAAAGLGLYTYSAASDAADESNKTPRGITKIEYASSDSQSVLKITFTPSIRILSGDDLTFRETKTTPVIDGPATVNSVVSNSQIVVDFGTLVVTDLTPGGYIDVKTTIGSQAAGLAGDAGADLGEAGGNFLGGAGSGFLGGLMPDWLTNSGSTVKWILIACCILLCLGGLAFVATKFL